MTLLLLLFQISSMETLVWTLHQRSSRFKVHDVSNSMLIGLRVIPSAFNSLRRWHLLASMTCSIHSISLRHVLLRENLSHQYRSAVSTQFIQYLLINDILVHYAIVICCTSILKVVLLMSGSLLKSNSIVVVSLHVLKLTNAQQMSKFIMIKI